MNEQPVVFVVDDDISVRDSMTNLFRSVGLNVEAFASAQDFLAFQPSDDAPRCLVLDVRLPGFSGLDLQRKMYEAHLNIPIVFITAHGDIRMSVQAMKAGAVEFLTKPFRDQELLDAVHQAIRRDRALRVHRAEANELHRRYESLSAREKEVMALVVCGLLNKQVAADLGTSEATIKLHRGRLMRKMRAGSISDLTRMAEKIGIPSRTHGAPSEAPPPESEA
jgi:FixJ family two-component response regulator